MAGCADSLCSARTRSAASTPPPAKITASTPLRAIRAAYARYSVMSARYGSRSAMVTRSTRQLRRDGAGEAAAEEIVAIDDGDALQVKRVDREAGQGARGVVVGRTDAKDPAVDARHLRIRRRWRHGDDARVAPIGDVGIDRRGFDVSARCRCAQRRRSPLGRRESAPQPQPGVVCTIERHAQTERSRSAAVARHSVGRAPARRRESTPSSFAPRRRRCTVCRLPAFVCALATRARRARGADGSRNRDRGDELADGHGPLRTGNMTGGNVSCAVLSERSDAARCFYLSG